MGLRQCVEAACGSRLHYYCIWVRPIACPVYTSYAAYDLTLIELCDPLAVEKKNDRYEKKKKKGKEKKKREKTNETDKTVKTHMADNTDKTSWTK